MLLTCLFFNLLLISNQIHALSWNKGFTQSIFTCSMSARNGNTRVMCEICSKLSVLLVLLQLTVNIFHIFRVSIIDIQQNTQKQQ